MVLGLENGGVMPPGRDPRASTTRGGPADLTYCTSVKPSAFKKSSATYRGATQIGTASLMGIRMVVVSSVSAAVVGKAGLAPQASSRAIPARGSPTPPATFKNWRRLR